jgi:hypothetical protein
MQAITNGLLVQEGEPIRIPALPECIITKEMISVSKDGHRLVEFIGDEFKKCFCGHKEPASPEAMIQAYRLLKDGNPSLLLQGLNKKQYLCSITAVLYLLEETVVGRGHLDVLGRINTFFSHCRKGDRAADLIRAGSVWKATANPIRFSGDTQYTSFKAGRVIYLPIQ